jgi:hypothetical protein
MTNPQQHYTDLQAIFDGPGDELARLTASFDLVTRNYAREYANEIEIAEAIGDVDKLLKARIQHGMIQSARGMFSHCYLKSTGEQPWKDDDGRE